MGKIPLIYFLPNLFTASSIFIAILSIIESTNGNFEKAGWFIIISMVLDGVDGRVARMTNTTSKFGMEFDSLADIVAFGVAPAMLLYFYAGIHFDKIGSLVSGLFVVFGAIRLARFNISTTVVEPNVFIGLPIPAGALFVVIWILSFINFNVPQDLEIVLLSVSFLIAILMVSNIRFPSFKKIDLSKSAKFKLLILLLILLSLLYLYPILILFILITVYTFFGIIRMVFNFVKRNRLSKN